MIRVENAPNAANLQRKIYLASGESRLETQVKAALPRIMKSIMTHVRALRISGPTLRRYLPPACLCVFFLLISTLFLLGNTQAYNAILWQLGVDPFSFPFLDTYGVLSTAECHAYGIDVIAENPCDVLGRTLDYSPFWLVTAKLGLHTGLTQFVGLTLDLLFLFWIFFLPALRGWLETTAFTLALFSSMVAFALERANLDLAIFVIAIVATNWALRRAIWRQLGYGLVMLAALVKYYPGVILILAIRERLIVLCALIVATIGVAALFVTYEGTDLLRVLAQIENGSWFNTAFGAQNLPRGLVELISSLFPASPLGPMMVELALALVAAAFAVTIATFEDLQDGLELLSERSRVFLLVGCALIVGCFFAAQNGAYRGIYFLFVLPAITELWRAPVSSAVRQRSILAGACVLFLMWSQFLDRAREEVFDLFDAPTAALEYSRFAFWLLREVVWWWVVTILLALALCLIYRSQSGQELLRLLLRPEKLSSETERRATMRGSESAAAKRPSF